MDRETEIILLKVDRISLELWCYFDQFIVTYVEYTCVLLFSPVTGR